MLSGLLHLKKLVLEGEAFQGPGPGHSGSAAETTSPQAPNTQLSFPTGLPGHIDELVRISSWWQ